MQGKGAICVCKVHSHVAKTSDMQGFSMWGVPPHWFDSSKINKEACVDALEMVEVCWVGG